MLKMDKTLDIQGVTDPTAWTMTKQTLDGMEPEQVLRVVTSNRRTAQCVMILCDRLGCSIPELSEDNGRLVITIQKQ